MTSIKGKLSSNEVTFTEIKAKLSAQEKVHSKTKAEFSETKKILAEKVATSKKKAASLLLKMNKILVAESRNKVRPAKTYIEQQL